MKNIKKIIYSLILIAVVVIPGKVFAVSGEVDLTCTPTSAYPNDIVTCIISADVEDGSIKEFAATTKLSDNLEFVSAQIVSGWTGTSDAGLFNLKTSTAQSETFEISSFTVKLSENFDGTGTITLTPTKLGDVTDLKAVSANINLASANSTQDSSSTTGEISTENGTATTNDPVKNPDTGSHIPFMIVGGGLIIGIIGYNLSARRKKIYKI